MFVHSGIDSLSPALAHVTKLAHACMPILGSGWPLCLFLPYLPALLLLLCPLLSTSEHPVCSGQADRTSTNRGCHHQLNGLVSKTARRILPWYWLCRIKHLGLPTLLMLQPTSGNSQIPDYLSCIHDTSAPRLCMLQVHNMGAGSKNHTSLSTVSVVLEACDVPCWSAVVDFSP